MVSITTTLEKFDSNLWGYHFPVPKNIADQFINGTDRRIICTINKGLSIPCALMPGKLDYFILINQEIRSKLKLKQGQEVDLNIEKDTSEFGMPMPETLRALLAQDEAGRKYFEALTLGKQRNLIYIVNKVKNIDSQINKALAILDHLKSNEGKLDFKMLNETIKEYNQRNKMR